MILDVSRIVSEEGASIPVCGTAALENLTFSGQDIRFIKPATVEGKAENIGGDLYLAADVSVTFYTACARCLKQIECTLEFTVNEVFSKRTNGADDDVRPLSSNQIALVPLIEDQFCMDLPYNYLCSDDCKGLCPMCGCDKNETSCDCEDEQIDPRLAALKDFLK